MSAPILYKFDGVGYWREQDGIYMLKTEHESIVAGQRAEIERLKVINAFGSTLKLAVSMYLECHLNGTASELLRRLEDMVDATKRYRAADTAT